tara:strand:- start:713 stop:1255 length:543 start_codon:yes stop_codon:yes gene_type:complete
MNFEKCFIEGIIICKPNIINDERGFFSETYRKDLLKNISNKEIEFCQTNTSESIFGTIRGLHFQKPPNSQSKLISVVRGEILDVVVDLRKNSKTFGKVFSIILNSKNNFQIFIPRGFAHGFSVLSKNARIIYHVDEYYNKESESGIYPLDNKLSIDWRLKKSEIILSDKDVLLPKFDKYE